MIVVQDHFQKQIFSLLHCENLDIICTRTLKSQCCSNITYARKSTASSLTFTLHAKLVSPKKVSRVQIFLKKNDTYHDGRHKNATWSSNSISQGEQHKEGTRMDGQTRNREGRNLFISQSQKLLNSLRIAEFLAISSAVYSA